MKGTRYAEVTVASAPQIILENKTDLLIQRREPLKVVPEMGVNLLIHIAGVQLWRRRAPQENLEQACQEQRAKRAMRVEAHRGVRKSGRV